MVVYGFSVLDMFSIHNLFIDEKLSTIVYEILCIKYYDILKYETCTYYTI